MDSTWLRERAAAEAASGDPLSFVRYQALLDAADAWDETAATADATPRAGLQ